MSASRRTAQRWHARLPPPRDPLFASFWQAGFEGADHVNGDGAAVDMNALTAHDRVFDTDYAQLQAFGIRTVRESLGWRTAHTAHGYDFARATGRARSAQRRRVQLLWTLCHYGLPPGCTPLDENFVDRCADFCARAARTLRQWQVHAPVYTPINEISFFTWALTSTSLFGPALQGADPGSVKARLVEATRAAADAIRAFAPDALIMATDPLCHVEAGAATEHALAIAETAAQFEAWDALQGERRCFDVAGVNYYHSNQWEQGSRRRLDWASADPRRRPFRALLGDLARRHPGPLLIAETSHVGTGRAAWIRDVAHEVHAALENGVDVRGICLYPVIDRPDWNDFDHWHRSGLWDIRTDKRRGRLHQIRVLDGLYACGLRQAQALCPESLSTSHLEKDLTMDVHSASGAVAGAAERPIFVYSHLRWGFVFQRPQHVMSRLAERHPVVFVEEPVFDPGPAHLAHSTPCANVRVITPHTPLAAPGYNDAQCRVVAPLLRNWREAEGLGEGVAWFYTPMALGMLAGATPELVVYDCMDELSAFLNAPAELRAKERELFARADLVFTGGPSLYRAKAAQHPRVYCFPSSVDVEHYAEARQPGHDHETQRALPRPRLGYLGVIDERLDLDLLRELAARRPDWQIVMAGPVVKIADGSLPRAPNIHYLGQQPYAALPALCAGWDVCLLPFALNDATRYISPTKTLEYLAAGRPVVSTGVADVVELYGSAVAIGHNIDDFISACDRALEDPVLRESHADAARAVLARTSWNRTVSRMRRLLSATRPRRAALRESGQALRAPQTRDRRSSTVILGAGPTGLSAAYHLDADATLLERNDSVGGWCRSIEMNGFTFDYAGHIMFSNDSTVLELYKVLLGDNVHWQNREAWIYSNGVHTRYPYQSALYGLPPQVLKECLIGAVEAHLRRMSTPADAAAGAPDFERFIHDTWGSGVARHFALPYNRKLWTVPLDEMETSWLGGRVPLPDLAQMIEGAVLPSIPPQGPNARFGYPLRGGFQALMNGFLPHITGRIELGAEVVRVQPEAHRLTLADGRSFVYESLVSTAPLPRLVAMIGAAAPAAVQAAAAALRHVSVRCVHLGIGRAGLTDKHWIYYPEDTVFHRIFVQGNASPACNPPGGFGLTCEISYSPLKPLPCSGQALIDRCVEDCIRVGLITRDDPIWASCEVDMPCAYVVYDHARERNVRILRDWLSQHDIVLAGRYSEWQYYNSDHAFLAGKRAAEAVQRERVAQVPRRRDQQRREDTSSLNL